MEKLLTKKNVIEALTVLIAVLTLIYEMLTQNVPLI